MRGRFDTNLTDWLQVCPLMLRRIPDAYLKQYFQPSFASAIAAGAPSVMASVCEPQGLTFHLLAFVADQLGVHQRRARSRVQSVVDRHPPH
jgi:hypothetical protein